MSGLSLEDRATAALERISGYPGAFDPTPDRRARWLAAIVKLSGAAADFAALAAETADHDALLEAGAIGDALLGHRADAAMHAVCEAQKVISPTGYLDLRDEWEDYGRDLASGETAGEEGQRLLITMAGRLKVKYGF